MSGNEFRRHRQRLGLTQVELAARIGVHPITLSRWEREESPVPNPVAKLVQLLKPERARKTKP